MEGTWESKIKKTNKCAQAFLYKQRCHRTCHLWCCHHHQLFWEDPTLLLAHPQARGCLSLKLMGCQDHHLSSVKVGFVLQTPLSWLTILAMPPWDLWHHQVPQAPGLKSGPQLLTWAPLLAGGIGFLNINYFYYLFFKKTKTDPSFLNDHLTCPVKWSSFPAVTTAPGLTGTVITEARSMSSSHIWPDNSNCD